MGNSGGGVSQQSQESQGFVPGFLASVLVLAMLWVV